MNSRSPSRSRPMLSRNSRRQNEQRTARATLGVFRMRCAGERTLCSTVVWAMLATFPLLAHVSPAAAQGQLSVDRAKQADAVFKAGYVALANTDLQGAREDFQKVVRLVPQIEEGHSALGAVLVQLNLYPEAISELTHALKLKPDDSAAQTNLAMAYANSDRNP